MELGDLDSSSISRRHPRSNKDKCWLYQYNKVMGYGMLKEEENKTEKENNKVKIKIEKIKEKEKSIKIEKENKKIEKEKEKKKVSFNQFVKFVDDGGSNQKEVELGLLDKSENCSWVGEVAPLVFYRRVKNGKKSMGEMGME